MSPVRQTRRRSLAALAAIAGTAALLAASPTAAQGVSGSSVAVAVNPTIAASSMPMMAAAPTMQMVGADDDGDLAVDAASVPAAARAQFPGSKAIFGDVALAISKPKLMFKLFDKFPNLALATNASATAPAVADLNVVVAKRMLALPADQASAVQSLQVPDLLGFLLGVKKQQLSWLSAHMSKGLMVGSPLKIGAMTVGYVPGAVQAAPTTFAKPPSTGGAAASSSASASASIAGGAPGSLVVGPGGVVLGTVNQGGAISMGAQTGSVVGAANAAVAPGVDAMEGPPAIVAPVAPPPVVAMPPAIPRPAVVAAPAPIPAPAPVVMTPMSVPAAVPAVPAAAVPAVPAAAVPAAVPAAAAPAAAAPAMAADAAADADADYDAAAEEEEVEGDYEDEEAAPDAAAAAAAAPAGTPALLSDGPAGAVVLRPEAGSKKRYASDSAAAPVAVSLDAVAAKLFAPVEAIALVVSGVKGKIARATAAEVADLNALAGLMG